MEKNKNVAIIIEDDNYISENLGDLVEVIGDTQGKIFDVIQCATLEDLKSLSLGIKDIRLAIVDGTFPRKKNDFPEKGMGTSALEHLTKTVGLSINKIIMHSGDEDSVRHGIELGTYGIVKNESKAVEKLNKAIEAVISENERLTKK